jgi:DNA-binding NarL/FixJ family response regulator
VLRLLAQGHNTSQISRSLAISKKTVEHHLSHIYDKIGASCRTSAVVYAVQQGLVQAERFLLFTLTFKAPAGRKVR